MPQLRIVCFSELRVELDHKPVARFDTDKTRALLVYLAVESGRPHRRSHLAALLWSDQSEEQSLHNLRQTLSCLRKVLQDNLAAVPFLLVERYTIQLNPDTEIWVDVKTFNDTLKAGYRFYQQRKGQGWLNIRRLSQALSLYQGPFLDQFDLNGSPLFDEWAALIREDNNRQAIEALTLLSEYHERRGEYNLARQAAIQIVKLAPWDETAQAQLMRLLAMDGQLSSAKNQYSSLRRYLVEYLGVEPAQETRYLFEQICAAGINGSSIPARFPLAHHNLPVLPTPFVGREGQLDRLVEMVVDPELRLLTLLGPGGIGKTRLALEVARQQVGVFPDGVFFVPLVSAQTTLHIVSLIAEAVGLFFSSQQDPQTQLLDYIREKHLLLLLDNFEHLLAGPGNTHLLAEILRQAPGIILLVTSRERLNLQEEWAYQLEGLEYPLDAKGAPEVLGSYEALALFTRRACQVRHDFALDPDNLPAVVQICQLLEGLPLGIELAAAAQWNQACAEIAEKIRSNLDALTTPASNLPARHRSMGAAFDVSWELLSPAEQDVFCRLALFRGGFNLEAARQVAGASPAMLSALVDKSLLRCDPAGRFDLHEAIRQFAADKLIALQRLDETRARQAAYFADFLDRLDSDLKGSGQMAALAAIHQEIKNTYLAWEWLVENRRAAEIAAGVDSLYQYFNVRSLFTEGIDWFRRASENLETDPAASLALGMVLSRLGALAHSARQNELACSALARSQEIITRLGSDQELAFCLAHTGGVHLRNKSFEAAQSCAQRSFEHYRAAGDLSGQSHALFLLGSIYYRQGNYHAARPLLSDSLAACRASGNQCLLAAPLNLLGDIACIDGVYPQAVVLFEESLAISRLLNDRYNQAILLNNLGTVYHIETNYSQARSFYEESLAICRDIGDQDGEAMALNNLGELALFQGRFSEAIAISEEALKIAQHLKEEWTIIVCLNNLGEAFCGLGQFSKSKQFFMDALQMAAKINGFDLLARLSVNTARLYQLQGYRQEAILLFQAALAHSATEHDSRQIAIRCLGEMQAEAGVEADDRALVEVLARISLL